jgi:glycosyltransferase involved in cell wall biosynthesis
MKLSVIIPAFNEENTIAFALESVLFQRVNFEYEVIVYDDFSDDKTAEIVRKYQQHFPHIKYYKNERNIGNAKTFYNALKVASGDYFQVLDGDDFFTNWHKLQKQVDFLDNNPDYCAVAHNYLKIEGDKAYSDNLEFKGDTTHRYCYDQNKLFRFYYHTSTFMFKNIFKHKLHKVLSEDFCRGDVVRFQLVQSMTNEKIKYLNFHGSVYNFDRKGIWSSLSESQKIELNQDFNQKRIKYLFSGIEKEAINLSNDAFVKSSIFTRSRKTEDNLVLFEDILKDLYRKCSDIVFSKNSQIKNYIFQNCNYFSQVDELLESIGRIVLFKKNLLVHQKKYKKDVYAFVIYGIKNDSGGGIIKEINDLINIFTSSGKQVYVFSTELVETSEEVVKKYFEKESVKFIRAEGSKFIDKISFLIDTIYDLAPEKMYPYISHNDVVGGAIIQKHLAKEIIMSWVYDHGTSIAVSNSSITRYIAKNDSYYYTLKSINRHNIVDIIPPSFKDTNGHLYVPFKNHKELVTASASARSYKVETPYVYDYCDIVSKILSKTNGKHYHYGPLTDEYKNKIYETLDFLKIDKTKFIHIEWENNFAKSLIEKEVDLFLSSFPVSSARIAIEVNSVGIPILGHESINRLFSIRHFVSLDNLFWEDEKDLFSIISNLNENSLKEISAKVRKFFEENNSFEACKDLLLSGGSKEYDETKISAKSLVNINLKDFQSYDKDSLCAKTNNKNKIQKLYYTLFILAFNILPEGFFSQNKYNKFLSNLKIETTSD